MRQYRFLSESFKSPWSLFYIGGYDPPSAGIIRLEVSEFRGDGRVNSPLPTILPEIGAEGYDPSLKGHEASVAILQENRKL